MGLQQKPSKKISLTHTHIYFHVHRYQIIKLVMHFSHCQNFLANHVPKTFFRQFTHSERPAKFLLCLIYCSHLCNTTAGIHSSCFLEFFMHRLHFACIWNSLPKVQTHLTFSSSSWITLSKILLRKKLTIGWLSRPIFYQTHTHYTITTHPTLLEIFYPLLCTGEVGVTILWQEGTIASDCICILYVKFFIKSGLLSITGKCRLFFVRVAFGLNMKLPTY